MDQTYRVRTIYSADGIDKSSADADRGAASFDRLGTALQRSQGLFQSLKFFSLQTVFQTFTSGARDLAGSLMALQTSSENTKLAFAGIMSAGGAPGAKDFNMALLMSDELLKKMREHARLLPGEFEDLNNVMQRALLPGVGGGRSVNEVEALSARMMAVGKALNMNSADVGSNLEMMLSGRAGMHAPLWAKMKTLIGMEAEQFNASSFDKKWEAIGRAIQGFEPMIKDYEKSWDAISSTSLDHLKSLARIGGGGFFDAMKRGLSLFNDAVRASLPQLEDMASIIGQGIGGAISFVIDRGAGLFSSLAHSPLLQRLGSFSSGVVQAGLGTKAPETATERYTASLGEFARMLLGKVAPTFEALVGAGERFVEGLAEWAAPIQDALANFFLAARPLGEALWTFGGKVLSIFGELLGGLFRFVGQLVGPLLTALVDFGTQVATFLTPLVEKANKALGIMDRDERTVMEDNVKAVVASPLYWAQQVGSSFPSLLTPRRPETAEQIEARALLNKRGIARKPDVHITGGLHIHQNMNNAPSPEVVLVKTKEALEQALTHPIESPGQRFSVLR